MPVAFRHRLFLGLVAIGTLPLGAALLTLALYVRSAASPAGPRAALDEIAASDRALIATLDTAQLDQAARAALRGHGETIARGATLAHRAETLSRAEAALLGVVVLAAALLVIGASLWLVRRWSGQLSAPVEELVDWTRRIQRGEPLPHGEAPRSAPELVALREALRDMASALDQARRQEIERERLGAFRETARRVAHEMRGPLNAALLAIRRIAAPGEANSERALSVLTEETQRLKRMADEFSAFGRLTEGPESDVDLAELVEGVLAATVPAECPVDRAIEPGLVIRGHYEALRRAVQNVVLNAVEATNGEGITIQARRRATDIACTIRDHGPGIPGDLRSRIFQPYVTTKPHGTGLGLAIAQQAVTAHGGSLAAEEAPGGGAAFVFTFPLP